MKSDLEEIKNLLLKEKSPTAKQEKSKPSYTSSGDNIWFDKARLESTKVAPAEPMLVLNNSEGVVETVEKAIVENSIPVTKSSKNNSGNLVVVCDSHDSCEKLQNIISSKDENVEMRSTTKKKPSITIVGFSKQFNKEEIVSQMVSQNQYVKQFSTVNDINEHIEIHDIKPTRSKPSVFQAFASVSEVLRKGFGNYNDKVTVGLTMACLIYNIKQAMVSLTVKYMKDFM